MAGTGLKVILFDLDGTLVKAGGSGRKALDRAVKRLYGVDQICSRFSLAGRTDKQNFHLAHLKATGKAPSAAHVRRLQAAYLKHLPHEVRKAVREGIYKEILGISKLLKDLSRHKNLLLGLGTGNIPKGAHLKLKPSGFLKYFSFGGYGSDSFSRAGMLKKAVKRAAKLSGQTIKSKDVYVIGDTPRDVTAGRKAGYRTGAVTSGYSQAAEVRKSRPDFMAAHFRPAGPWIRWILK